MPEAIISAKGTEAPTVRSGRFTVYIKLEEIKENKNLKDA